MNEHDLKTALRGVMTTTPAPPSMSASAVLDVAKQAERRRRATLLGASSAAAVVLIAAGAIIVGSLNRPGTVGTGGPGVQPTGQPDVPTGTLATPDTKTSWPDGQTDRTATQGPRADKGVRLLDMLTESVPADLRAPLDLKAAAGSQRHGDLRSHQAQFADEVAGKQIWEYMVSIPVGANGKWGHLLAEVHTAGNQVRGEGCDLTTKLWGMGGECELVTVGGKQVGVAIRPTGDNRFDQWAAYRHPDGTVVFIAQAKTYDMTGLTPLTTLPFTPEQLATLAMDPKFHLN